MENIIFLFIACIFLRAFICDVIHLQIYVKTYIVELCNLSNSKAFMMARRLSGRQLLDQIFADESDSEDSESSNDVNSSSGSEFQVESDDSNSEEADDDGGDDID